MPVEPRPGEELIEMVNGDIAVIYEPDTRREKIMKRRRAPTQRCDGQQRRQRVRLGNYNQIETRTQS